MSIRPRGKVERFTDLEVWQKSHELLLNLLNDLQPLPNSRAATILANQIIRSLGSVGANIAEGFNRSRSKYLNSLDIALGEANETENWLYKLRDARLLPREQANTHVAEIIQVQKMLAGLIRAIRRSSPAA